MSGLVLQDLQATFLQLPMPTRDSPDAKRDSEKGDLLPYEVLGAPGHRPRSPRRGVLVEADETLERLTLETLSHERFVGQVVRDDERVVYSSIKKATRSFHRPPPCAPVAAIVKTPQGR